MPDHPVLRRLYPSVCTLRQYLLAQTAGSSKSRRRRLAQVGVPTRLHASPTQQIDEEVGRLLDTALVATLDPAVPSLETSQQRARARDQDVAVFSQQRSPATTATTAATLESGYLLQSEIVDFVIWCLFKRSPSHKPAHVLCHGFQRGAYRPNGASSHPVASIPGLTECYPNSSVQTLKTPPWCRLHAMLGPGGDRVMMGLLLDCCIFLPVPGNMGNFYQLSGTPLSDWTLEKTAKSRLPSITFHPETPKDALLLKRENRMPGAITFVRSRILYARAALNARGGVRFGLLHIHALNRYPDLQNEEQTVQILRYIFPRQFGLHNVFTSHVEPRECALPFMDYTLREKDMHNSMRQALGKNSNNRQEASKWRSRTPKRLRGAATAWANKLRILHRRCSYLEMLRHYCPVEGVPLSPNPASRRSTYQPLNDIDAVAGAPDDSDDQHLPKYKCSTVEQTFFTDMACPAAHISAFCRAVVAKVIPESVWGTATNRRIIMYWIDQFIVLRRFESLTLHQVTQELQVTTLDWLNLPNVHSPTKLSKTDFDKRKEILLEFIYWLFDSYLITLIRSNFHVTESNVHRNRLFYFRHDVWRMLTEPALVTLKSQMFEEVPMETATRLMSARQLGFSKIRLLPKRTGFRTIMNLKRRQQILRNGVPSLGRSINTVMAPVFHAITYERSRQPDRFGSSLFSVGDMLPKLAAFKASLREKHLGERPLYFAKVDVRSCFDTIPQDRVVAVVNSLMKLQTYTTGKHVEVSLLGDLQRLHGKHVDSMPLKRYVAHSGSADEVASFGQLVRKQLVGAKANTVFVNTSLQRHETKDDLMRLLREHVERNLVKIGKKYYRQKKGIPQGSVLSSILCNLFYAELERDVLDFALEEDCLLLRLLDDFLLISINRARAERFVRVMHRGHSDYGVVVQLDKSLTNFDMMTDDGGRVPSTPTDFQFPYCGVCIDTRTLEVGKKTVRARKAGKMTSKTR